MKWTLLLVLFQLVSAALLEETEDIPTYNAIVSMVNPASEMSDDSVSEIIPLDDSSYLDNIQEAESPDDRKLFWINGAVLLSGAAGFNAGLCYELMQVRQYLESVTDFAGLDLFTLVLFSLLALVLDQLFSGHCILNTGVSGYRSVISFAVPFIKFLVNFAGFFFVEYGANSVVTQIGPNLVLGLVIQTIGLFLFTSLYTIIVSSLNRR